MADKKSPTKPTTPPSVKPDAAAAKAEAEAARTAKAAEKAKQKEEAAAARAAAKAAAKADKPPKPVDFVKLEGKQFTVFFTQAMPDFSWDLAGQPAWVVQLRKGESLVDYHAYSPVKGGNQPLEITVAKSDDYDTVVAICGKVRREQALKG